MPVGELCFAPFEKKDGLMTDLVAEILPVVERKNRMNLLFNCTAYPCGGKEIVREQLLRLKKETDGTFAGCIAYSQRKSEEEAALFDAED